MSIYALKSRFQALLRPAVRRMYASGITAKEVTTTACLASIAIGAALVFLPRRWFLLLPVWMFVRMALNAMDGMLAREFGQKSVLGAYLNELSDVVSDAALYLPFAFVAPFGLLPVGSVIFLSALSEMAGVVGVMAGATRRYDGPMGKSDRAFVFSLFAIWVAAIAALPAWAAWLMWAVALAVAVTTGNRVRAGVRESRGAAASAAAIAPPATVADTRR